MKQRLLFITPKIDESHDDLAFASLWAKAFANAGYDVTAICHHKGKTSLPFPVYSTGGEKGWPNWRCAIEFQKLMATLKYDRVFVHMSAPWLAAGTPIWFLKRVPVYMWYTHYTNPWTLKLGSALVVKRFFAATKESLPHYDHDPRKVITGHGIDTSYWDDVHPALNREPRTHLLAVHRISRSKRLDVVIKTLANLPVEYKLTHYGRPMGPADDVAYEKELHELVKQLGLQDRVRFMGSVPGPELKKIYPRYQTFINLVPKTIDKTVLEAMYCGLTPVIGQGQAEAIGYPHFPRSEDPKEIAEYIQHMHITSPDELKKLVRERHSLESLIQKMSVFIQPGN